MKIEEQTRIALRSIHHAAFQSEETYCFTATLLFDGEPVCTVGNDGHGGAHKYTPLKGQTMTQAFDALRPVEAFAATIEKQVIGDGIALSVDVDLIVNNLVADWLDQRDLDRALRKRWMYVRDGKLFYVPKVKAPNLQLWTLEYKQRFRTEPRLLNAMPRNEALALYRGFGQ